MKKFLFLSIYRCWSTLEQHHVTFYPHEEAVNYNLFMIKNKTQIKLDYPPTSKEKNKNKNKTSTIPDKAKIQTHTQSQNTQEKEKQKYPPKANDPNTTTKT